MGCLLSCRKGSTDVSKTQFPKCFRKNQKKPRVTSGPSAHIAYSPVEAPVFKIHSVIPVMKPGELLLATFSSLRYPDLSI